MRKSRPEETSKRVSNAERSQTRSKTQVSSKSETLEKKRKIIETKLAGGETKSKSSKSSDSLNKQNGSKEADQRMSSLISGSRPKVGGSSGNGETLRRTSKRANPERSKRTPAEGSKTQREKQTDSERRGTSTIYMPKASLGSKIVRESKIGEVAGGKASSRNKQRPETKVTVERTKNASNGVKSSSSQNPIPRDRRRSRTLSPSEVKVLRSTASVPQSSSKKNSDTKNIAKKDSDEEYVYQDDFEDYESDFEECTDSDVSEVSETISNKSNEVAAEAPIELRTEKQKTTINSVGNRKMDEDRMLDSGHYELAEARRRAAQFENILPRNSKTSPLATEIMIRSSISPYREEMRSGEQTKSLPSSTDEGFEDSRSGDFVKSPPLSQLSIVDFCKTSKDNVIATKTTKPKVLSRGEKILEMIKLDTVEWSIWESKPIAYEEFIRNHGKLNTRQIYVQTNEDNLEVEIQTEEIESTSKWTQFPARCRTILKNDQDIKLFNAERLGVGSEDDLNSAVSVTRPTYDILRLNEFLSQASKVMLCLLEEKVNSNNSTSTENCHELPFSDSIVKLAIDNVTFLTGRAVTMIHYSNVSNRVLLTIHAPTDEEVETSRKDDFVTDCSIGCVWNILQPSRPMKIFYSPCKITSCCFHSTSYNVVLAGLEDGSISIWDLAEDETWHRKIIDEINHAELIVRSPTYTSSGHFQTTGHSAEIVALRVLSKIEGEVTNFSNNNFMPIQISSLDANGLLIVWSVLRNMGRASIDDLGLSWWGKLKLVKSQEISLHSKKMNERNSYLKGFTDMHVDRLDTNALYIATNTTNILHATSIGRRANPPVYKSNVFDLCGATKCIENCPFDQPFFLVGCDDGTIRLHSSTSEAPLLQLKHDDCKASIKALQWSKSKPLTIYVLDIDSKIHIWDLGNSDMFPIHSISTKNWAHIGSIVLSPCRTIHELANQYMALASDNGCVEIHRLNKYFHYTHRDAIKREINTFLRYVEIL